ncbi:MAG: PilZ domain-containing protein [Myxococcales bacterium]|nr:PilZ domain-containing protein [Myxococcales bacterium]
MGYPSMAERRRAPRARIAGNALVHVNPWCCHRYELADLSASGARLYGPHVRLGRRVRLVVRVDGADPLWLDGRVVRHGEDSGEVAIAFDDLDPTTEDTLQDLALAVVSGRRLHALPMDLSVDYEPMPSEPPPDDRQLSEHGY